MKGFILPTLIWFNRKRYNRYDVWLELWRFIFSWLDWLRMRSFSQLINLSICFIRSIRMFWRRECFIYDETVFGLFISYDGICFLRLCVASAQCASSSVWEWLSMIVHSSLRGVSWTYSSAVTYCTLKLVSLYARSLALLNYFWLIIWCKVMPGM